MLSPTRLLLPAALLSRPEYAWECRGFRVNEGPSVLIRGEGIPYLLRQRDGRALRRGFADRRRGQRSAVPGKLGQKPGTRFSNRTGKRHLRPGHNSFTTDAEGNDLIVFHARPYPGFHGTPLSDPNRHTYLRR
jgi:GH43 family beta-xylosidase